MVELGILREDEPLELIDGELVEVNPQGPIHSTLAVRVRRALDRIYGETAHVRDHSPIEAGENSLPEPDVAVVRGAPEDYLEHHPRADELILVVEIAYTSRNIDRAKAAVYARAGVRTYWLVDVPARRIEVRTEPSPRGEYRVTTMVEEDAELALPERDETLPVAALLP